MRVHQYTRSLNRIVRQPSLCDRGQGQNIRKAWESFSRIFLRVEGNAVKGGVHAERRGGVNGMKISKNQ